MANFAVWGVEVDLDFDSVLEAVLWCLPLLLIAALIWDRVARRYPLDPVADASVLAAAIFAVAAVAERRYRRGRGPRRR